MNTYSKKPLTKYKLTIFQRQYKQLNYFIFLFGPTEQNSKQKPHNRSKTIIKSGTRRSYNLLIHHTT